MWHIRLSISAESPGGGGAFPFLIPQPGNFHLCRDEIMSSLCQLDLDHDFCLHMHACTCTRAHNKLKYVALFLDMLMFMQQG